MTESGKKIKPVKGLKKAIRKKEKRDKMVGVMQALHIDPKMLIYHFRNSSLLKDPDNTKKLHFKSDKIMWITIALLLDTGGHILAVGVSVCDSKQQPVRKNLFINAKGKCLGNFFQRAINWNRIDSAKHEMAANIPIPSVLEKIIKMLPSPRIIDLNHKTILNPGYNVEFLKHIGTQA